MQDALMDILNFTADDLNANRQQRRSPAQQAALNRAKRGFWRGVVYVIAFVVLVTGLARILDPLINMDVIDSSGWNVVNGIMAVITVVIIVALYDNKRLYRLDAQEESIASVTGTLQLIAFPNSIDSGSLEVQQYMFALNKKQFQALAALLPLPEATVYYAPRSKHLLSVDLDTKPDTAS